MEIRKTLCSRCSCLWVMKSIYKYKKEILETWQEVTEIEEILSYWDLQGEFFQCYMDGDWTKCKGLYDYVEFFKKNPEIEKQIQNNLSLWIQKIKN